MVLTKSGSSDIANLLFCLSLWYLVDYLLQFVSSCLCLTFFELLLDIRCILELVNGYQIHERQCCKAVVTQ